MRMAVERDFTDPRGATGLVEKLATTAHGRTLVGKLNKVPKKRVRSLLKAKARDAVQGGGAGETKWQKKQRPRLHAGSTPPSSSAGLQAGGALRGQPFGAGDAEDIAETEYHGAHRAQCTGGPDAIDPIIDVDEL